MTDKKDEVVVQPDTVKIDGNVAIEASGDVTVSTGERNGTAAGQKTEMLEPELPADIQATMDENASDKPKTKKVKTGKNIITGKDVMKEVEVPYERDYSAGRKLFPVHTSVNGSFNGRKMNLVKGEEIYLNEGELSVFRNYVHGKGK